MPLRGVEEPATTRQESIREHWEEGDRVRHLRDRARTRNFRAKASLVAESVRAVREGRILEIGPGSGDMADAYLESAGDQVEHFVVDISHNILVELGRFRRVQADMSRLPFPDGAFQAVASVATFMYSACGRDTAREWVRVLAPGGRLALIDANRGLLMRRTPHEPENKRLPEVAAWFAEAGLRVERAEYFVYTPNRPTFLGPIYDIVNRVCPCVPFVRRFSTTYCVMGTKTDSFLGHGG